MKITETMVNRAVASIPERYWAHPSGSCDVPTRVKVMLSAAVADEHGLHMAFCRHCRKPIGRFGDERWNHLSVPQPVLGTGFDGYICNAPTEAEP